LVIPSQSTDALALLERYAAPSAQHWLGQDELGRDVLQRLMQGGQVTLLVGLGGAALATVLGASLGLLAAVRGGWWDAALMRVTDGVMTLPLLPLLIILAAMDYSKLGLPPMLVHSELFTVLRLIVIIGLVGWTGTARLTRNAALAVLARDFVKAARALGAGDARITLRHVLPNILPMLAVAAALAVGHAILIESALSFLGVGIQPPTPSWGNMLTNAQEIVFSAPWLAIYPGLLIFLTVTACNLVAEGRG
jgi:peptide/nickel transport system permease protein